MKSVIVNSAIQPSGGPNGKLRSPLIDELTRKVEDAEKFADDNKVLQRITLDAAEALRFAIWEQCFINLENPNMPGCTGMSDAAIAAILWPYIQRARGL